MNKRSKQALTFYFMRTMKSFISISFFVFFGVNVFSQNVFPPTGNVGIGTLNPAYTLEVNGTLRANQIFIGGTIG
jgi:hypothetical protein